MKSAVCVPDLIPFYTTFFVHSRPFPPSNPPAHAPNAHEIAAIAQNYNIREMQVEQRLSEAKRRFERRYVNCFLPERTDFPTYMESKNVGNGKRYFLANKRIHSNTRRSYDSALSTRKALTMSPRKLIAEFVRKGIESVTLVSRAGQKKLGAVAALTMLAAIAAGPTPAKAADAGTTLDMPAAACFWEFAEFATVNGRTVAKIEDGKAVLFDHAVNRADDLVNARWKRDDHPFMREFRALKARAAAIDHALATASPESDAYKNAVVEKERHRVESEILARNAETAFDWESDKLLEECGAKIVANPDQTIGHLDRAQLDDWFTRRPPSAQPAMRIH